MTAEYTLDPVSHSRLPCCISATITIGRFGSIGAATSPIIEEFRWRHDLSTKTDT